MPYDMIKKIIFALLLFLSITSQAQDRPFTFSTTVGVTMPILDNGLGFHLGINPAYPVSEHFYVEGQLSYLYTRVGASFLSGEQANIHAFNALAGGRLYLNKEMQTNRFYLNLLLGGNFQQERKDSETSGHDFGPGFSAGSFLQREAFLLGLSYDTPQNLVLKAGYVF
jgi:hypothetical protein